MLYFFLAVGALLLGYVTYGRLVERVFGADERRATPACTMEDGVDYVQMGSKKTFLIQLLNIAGLGPIFGPILGALYGPAALLWIVIGSIFAGAVHDYFSGMMSVRYGGKSVPDIVGYNLGVFAKQFMNIFAVLLLLLVGVVFVLGPAKLLAVKLGFGLEGENAVALATSIWTAIIFGYYFIATILPVDKIIGRLYPLFAVALLVMAFGLTFMLIVKGYDFYPQGLTLENLHPKELPLWPLMFITIACGAVSGFHATQSPLMARCVPNEKYGRPVFYGAMISEGIIALIWATLGMAFFHTPEALQTALDSGGPAAVVDTVSIALMGPVGGFLAIIGVIVLPVTSGDTAFRSARLIIADFINLPQKSVIRRLAIAIPLFLIGYAITYTPFAVIWRYFGFANQTLATVMLWASAVYLIRQGKGAWHWMASIPAIFMTAVCATYLAYAQIGFNLPMDVAQIIGVGVALACAVFFFVKIRTLRVDGEEAARS